MIALWLLAGAAWGSVAMLSLRWTVERLRPQASGQALLIMGGGVLLRLAIAAGVLLAALRHSILYAGLALVGMLMARSVLLLATLRRQAACDGAASGQR
jgi:hypothetical protein